MTSGWQPRTPGPGRPPVEPVDPRTRLQRDGSFTDKVMARVAEEPTPSPGRVFVRSLRRLAVRDALLALAAAWRLAFEPASPVAASARASAAALFLSVVIVVGLGGAFVTGGALSVLGPDGAAPPELAPGAAPTASPAPTIAPTPSPAPTPPPTPVPTATPSAREQSQGAREDGTKRATPKPAQTKKRETPEPKERDEKDEKDERDEKDEKDERDDD